MEKLREIEFRLAGKDEILKGWFHCWSTVADSDGSDCYATVEDEKGECYQVAVHKIRFLDRPDRKPASSPIVEFLRKNIAAKISVYDNNIDRMLGFLPDGAMVVWTVKENNFNKIIETTNEAEAVKALAGE